MDLHFNYLAEQYSIELLEGFPESLLELVFDPPKGEDNGSRTLAADLMASIQNKKKKVKKIGCTIENIVNELMRTGDGASRVGNYHTTELIKCPRAAAFLRRGEAGQDNFNSKSRYIFAVGKVLHCLTQGMILSVYPKAKIEVPVEIPELYFVGSADVVLPDEVIEIKSIKEAPALPQEAHLYQVMLYAGVLRKPKWTILYVDKSGNTLKSFSGSFSQKLWDKMIQTLVVLETKYKDVLPPKPPNINNYTCKNCKYKQICEASDGRGEAT